jgi:hypothetical protein
MGRKEATFTATDGRDKGRRYHIVEMSSRQSEEWAGRAIFTLMNFGVDIPDDMLTKGLAGLAAIGIKALSKVPFEAARPLFEEMMGCVEFMPDPKNAAVLRPLIDDDIEEVATRLKLRKAVLDLHLDFFIAAGRSISQADSVGQTPD